MLGPPERLSISEGDHPFILYMSVCLLDTRAMLSGYRWYSGSKWRNYALSTARKAFAKTGPPDMSRLQIIAIYYKRNGICSWIFFASPSVAIMRLDALTRKLHYASVWSPIKFFRLVMSRSTIVKKGKKSVGHSYHATTNIIFLVLVKSLSKVCRIHHAWNFLEHINPQMKSSIHILKKKNG